MEKVQTDNSAVRQVCPTLEPLPNDDEAYKAVAFLYGAIKEDELQRDGFCNAPAMYQWRMTNEPRRL